MAKQVGEDLGSLFLSDSLCLFKVDGLIWFWITFHFSIFWTRSCDFLSCLAIPASYQLKTASYSCFCSNRSSLARDQIYADMRDSRNRNQPVEERLHKRADIDAYYWSRRVIHQKHDGRIWTHQSVFSIEAVAAKLSCASNAWYCWLELTNCRFVMVRSSVLSAQVACFLRAVFFVLQGKWCSSFSKEKWRQSLNCVEIISISPEILETKRWAECEKLFSFQDLQLVQQSLPSNRPPKRKYWFLSRSLFCVLDYHGSKMLDWLPLRDDENLISSEGRGRKMKIGSIPCNRRIFELSVSLRRSALRIETWRERMTVEFE